MTSNAIELNKEAGVIEPRAARFARQPGPTSNPARTSDDDQRAKDSIGTSDRREWPKGWFAFARLGESSVN